MSGLFFSLIKPAMVKVYYAGDKYMFSGNGCCYFYYVFLDIELLPKLLTTKFCLTLLEIKKINFPPYFLALTLIISNILTSKGIKLYGNNNESFFTWRLMETVSCSALWILLINCLVSSGTEMVEYIFIFKGIYNKKQSNCFCWSHWLIYQFIN